MRVMKFGGTSVGDPPRIANLCDIVGRALDREPVVVVSAASKVTDMLLTAARHAAEGAPDAGPVARRVTALLDAFGLDHGLIAGELQGLREALEALSLARALSPEALDTVASYGERISVRTIAAALSRQGVPADPLDAWDAGMITDDTFGAAEPLEASEALLRERLKGRGRVPVVTGFIGKTLRGEVTTLGRGGSDYSAAIVGAAVGADEIEIWTDVPGVLSSDPRVVPEAFTIPVLSFNEAAELAYFGAKVLHPKTIHPAVRRGIPVRVKNTFAPAHPGTVITAEGDSGASGARAIAHKRGITVVNVVSTRMLLAHGFLARIFEAFARHRVVVDLVSTSEVSVSCTVDREDGLAAALKELGTIGEVSVTRERTLLCVVCARLLGDPTVAPGIFQALGREAIPVELISMGASAINVSLVVPDGDGERAVRALHRELFPRAGA
ncbi:MAG: aspartate kinase [Deltaproteobacteria bacterium]|nr:aspartate kinase [Deltaproteobacteria bacterium]